ncbi:MAG: NADH-quinone oxidoreductase subunit B family protein [Rhodospirillaceae bacterium]
MKLFAKILQVGLVTETLPGGGPEPASHGGSPGPVERDLARRIDRQARRVLGGAVAIRQVDAGSCNGCEIEIGGLTGPVYDLEQYGLHFVASPRHADLLLVTGPVTRNMVVPLRKTWEATPDPKLVVAVGDCAHDCGVFAGSYAVAGRVQDVIPVDAVVLGCPPAPADILRGILAVLGRTGGRRR